MISQLEFFGTGLMLYLFDKYIKKEKVEIKMLFSPR